MSEEVQSQKTIFEKDYNDRTQTITEFFTNDLKKKGENLIKKDSASVASMMEDNSFNLLREFLKSNFTSDLEIIIASFFTVEGNSIKAWQYVSRSFPLSLQIPIEYNKAKKSWISSYNKNGKVIVYDPEILEIEKATQSNVILKEIPFQSENGKVIKVKVYDCYIPIYRKSSKSDEIVRAKKAGETIGYLRYVLSLQHMEKIILGERKKLENNIEVMKKQNFSAEQRAHSVAATSLQNNSLFLGFVFVIVLLMAYWASWIFSNRITRPIKLLTTVAQSMARSDYHQTITIDSDDEIGLFASAFREMRAAILKRDEELALINKNLEELVEQRTKQLKDQIKTATSLLDNMQQSVFSMSSDGLIVPPVSKFSEKVFGKVISGRFIFDCLYKDLDLKGETYCNIKSAISTIFGETALQWDLMEHNFPKQVLLNVNNEDKTLKVAQTPILDDNGTLEKVLFVVEDITSVLRLEAERAVSDRNTRIIQELAKADLKQVKDFFLNSLELLQEIKSILHTKTLIKSEFNIILRHLHTLKGNSRLYELSLISTLTHSIEDHLSNMNLTFNFSSNLFEINDQISQWIIKIEVQLSEYIEIGNRIFGIENENNLNNGFKMIEVIDVHFNQLKDALDQIRVDHSQVNINLLIDKFNLMLMVPVPPVLNRLAPMVQDLSKKIGKNVEYSVKGDSITFDRNNVKLLGDSILHMIRNSLDHGIELPNERIALGKRPVGSIEVICKEEKEGSIILIRDDGSGINPEQIAQVALNKGLISQDEMKTLNRDQKIELIFLLGLSTKETVSELSGRGVGMNVVKSNIEKINGKLTIETEAKKGTTIRLFFQYPICYT